MSEVRMALALTPSFFPVVILEDMAEAADHLKQELNKRQIRTHECVDIAQLIAVASELSAAMFAIDLDMGEGREEEGLDAISTLRAMSDDPASDKCFIIIALTSHSELEHAAIERGAHSFVVKDEARSDVLELLIRLSAHTIEIEKQWSLPIQSELASRGYENLRRKLDGFRQSGSGLSSCVATIRKALNWPFLVPDEQLVLSTIDEQLRVAQLEEYLDADLLQLCIEGVEIIARVDMSETAIGDWMQRVRKVSPNALFPWLDPDDIESDLG